MSGWCQVICLAANHCAGKHTCSNAADAQSIRPTSGLTQDDPCCFITYLEPSNGSMKSDNPGLEACLQRKQPFLIQDAGKSEHFPNSCGHKSLVMMVKLLNTNLLCQLLPYTLIRYRDQLCKLTSALLTWGQHRSHQHSACCFWQRSLCCKNHRLTCLPHNKAYNREWASQRSDLARRLSRQILKLCKHNMHTPVTSNSCQI